MDEFEPLRADYFPGRLRELRIARGWNQQELAEASGASLSAISKWEQGLKVPYWDSVVALCNALRVSPAALVERPARISGAKPGRPKKKAGSVEPPAKKKKRAKKEG